MADYVFINNFNRGGELGISRNVFAKIALDAVTNSTLKTTVKAKEPVNVIFKKDGRVIISLKIELRKGSKATEVCSNLQEEIAHALDVYLESIPFEIEISVERIK